MHKLKLGRLHRGLQHIVGLWVQFRIQGRCQPMLASFERFIPRALSGYEVENSFWAEAGTFKVGETCWKFKVPPSPGPVPRL